ncbi:MAG: hypothetical protein ACXIVQ_05760 [Acidimicrobiales bacterium]
MAFGQHPGPPATAKQIAELTELIHRAGHTDFRDARGPLGLTQRQAGGKFTRDEADEFIARLEAEVDGAPPEVGAPPAILTDMPDAVLAAELQRRGWVVLEP